MASADIAMQDVRANHAHHNTANSDEQWPVPSAYHFRKPADGTSDVAQDNQATDVESGNSDSTNIVQPHRPRASACCDGCTCPRNWLLYQIWFCIVLGLGAFVVYGYVTMSTETCERSKRDWVFVSMMVIGLSAVCWGFEEAKALHARRWRRNPRERKYTEIAHMLFAGGAVVMGFWAAPAFALNQGPCQIPDGLSVIALYSWPDAKNVTVMLTNGTMNTTALHILG